MIGRIISALCALALGACASLSDQPRNEVRVRVGPEQERAYRAEPYAALYASYAMISSLAYTTREHGNRNLCPDQSSLDRQHDDYATMWMRSLSEKKWHCVFGLSETQPCPQRYRDCNPLGVPDLQVWRRDNPFCSELVIAFRGVNLMDPSDWSYLRWLLPRPGASEAMQARVEDIVTRTGCRRAGTRVVTVGHSLGGGLAEETAYANGRVRYVYAFNAFPIAAFFDPGSPAQARNKIGLGVDNVYEAGEILDLPRWLLRGPGTACNPRIRTVRFNLAPFGFALEKHRIDTLTINMLDLARPGIGARPAAGYRSAAHCGDAVAGVNG